MVPRPTIARLHVYRRFVGLNVTATEQLAPHHFDKRYQYISNSHYPAIERRATDVDTRVAQQDHALTI